jgi:hypothetical protein
MEDWARQMTGIANRIRLVRRYLAWIIEVKFITCGRSFSKVILSADYLARTIALSNQRL